MYTVPLTERALANCFIHVIASSISYMYTDMIYTDMIQIWQVDEVEKVDEEDHVEADNIKLEYFTPSQSDKSKEMQKVIAKYEAIAKITCEATGNPGVLMKSTGGWFKTLDPEYAKSTLFFKNFTVVGKTNNE